MSDSVLIHLVDNLPQICIGLATLIGSVIGAWASIRNGINITKGTKETATKIDEVAAVATNEAKQMGHKIDGNTAITAAIGVTQGAIPIDPNCIPITAKAVGEIKDSAADYAAAAMRIARQVAEDNGVPILSQDTLAALIVSKINEEHDRITRHKQANDDQLAGLKAKIEELTKGQLNQEHKP